MGKPRVDTYELDVPEQPPFSPYAEFDDAKSRKKELIKNGFRAKIRKDNDGAYVVWKKHDELFHDMSWRDKHA